MDAMDLDDEPVVDLSMKRSSSPSMQPEDLSRPTNLTMNSSSGNRRVCKAPRKNRNPEKMYLEASTKRRSLRPRVELSYAESPDFMIISDEEVKMNGYGGESDSDDEMPPLPPIKELSPEELCEKMRQIRKLKEELRNEEMKLILLKKIKQSQSVKENITVMAPPQPSPSLGKTATAGGKPAPQAQTQQLKSGQSTKYPSPGSSPQVSRSNHSQSPNVSSSQLISQGGSRSGGSSSVSGLSTDMLLQQQSSSSVLRGKSTHSILGRTGPPNVVMGYPIGSRDTKSDSQQSSTSITPSSSVSQSRTEDTQTPAQRQAAAKLALRKQLEKTLLQIPPPKPPPPEMHFIPNANNTEFVYFLGLEIAVDHILKEKSHIPPPIDPFICSQCGTDFTPVWKWDKPKKGREPRVICEQCVTSNVKLALKAEHTNRLKTAFVKALQQEQEIEQRMAQVTSSPQPDPVIPISTTISLTPSVTITKQPPAAHSSTPPSSSLHREHRESSSHRDHRELSQSRDHRDAQVSKSLAGPSMSDPKFDLGKLTDPTKFLDPTKLLFDPTKFDAAKFAQFNAANLVALQAAQQQLMRLPQHPTTALPTHMLNPFNQFFHPYQLAMAAAGSKNPSVANLAELQRQTNELHRQYLLDMIPPRTLPQGNLNWKS